MDQQLFYDYESLSYCSCKLGVGGFLTWDLGPKTWVWVEKVEKIERIEIFG
jgi:hypothetical protein